jgi:hypothetical protein
MKEKADNEQRATSQKAMILLVKETGVHDQ